MNQLLQNKKYYIDLINSTKANKFVSYYHYSHIGFRKALLNQGIYDKETNKLVGVLQWGHSSQEGIRLDTYVNEDIKVEEYYELNRFCMDDEQDKNSESQAISLGIKWIKQNQPKIRLLVSYAGRKEGNYGYIYQATNWEYLGYFISNGFWILDGQERHNLNLWYTYNRYGTPYKTVAENACDRYHDVIQTWTKQFVYIQRLDKKLTVNGEIHEYPKPATDFPIKVREKIHKEDLNYRTPKEIVNRIKPDYSYVKEKQLFTTQTLKKRAMAAKKPPKEIKRSKRKIKLKYYGKIPGEDRIKYRNIGYYDCGGQLIGTADIISQLNLPDYDNQKIRDAIRFNKQYKDYFFKAYPAKEEIPEHIETNIIGIIYGIYFNSFADMGKYVGVSRQAI